jgi:hypothetical protein
MSINQMVQPAQEQAQEEASNNHRFYAVEHKHSTEIGTVKVKVMKKSGAMRSAGINRGCFAVTFELNGKRISRANLEQKLTE